MQPVAGGKKRFRVYKKIDRLICTFKKGINRLKKTKNMHFCNNKNNILIFLKKSNFFYCFICFYKSCVLV